ncbi:MAG: hypothetical protein JSS24_07295 [Proteobacteria bacterium]|nr:hypothetical protein [Pseudomonadota bacterium]
MPMATTRLRPMLPFIAGLVLSATVADATPAGNREAGRLRSAITHHQVSIGGRVVGYTAAVREFRVADPAGRVGASVITIAYTRDEVAGAHRPLIFAFNGGPGASSSPLHMKALGPVIRARAKPGEEPALVDNTVSVLDTADLVFIDPVSTGFSRALPGVDPRPWYDSRFDADTVAAVIGQWLHANHREGSPRYLMGESYGTIRAGLIVTRVPRLRFDGVLLVSGMGAPLDAPADVRIVSSIASMAAGAWYHRKVDRRGLSSADFFHEAMVFARGPYAQALARGQDLPEDDKRRIATQLSAFIGLPVDLILKEDLRIEANTYMFNLLKDQGLRTGRLDLRVTGPLAPGQEGAIDDPALGVVKPGAHSGPAPTPASIGAVESPDVGRYLTQQLHFASTEPYIGVNFLANSQWTFHPDPSTEVNLAAAMSRDHRLRLFVTAGYFDFGAADGRLFLQAGVPAQRFVFVPLPGPHEVYEGVENRAAFNQAVRQFVSRFHP